MGVDRPLVRLERDAVDRVKQLRAREDPARRSSQVARIAELGRGQLHPAAGGSHAHPRQVELDVTDDDAVGRLGGRFGASEHRADPGDQLPRAERLGHVVVGAELEADERVRLVAARGEHHDRDRRGRPQPTRDVEPVEARQPEVEDDEVGMVPSRGLEGGRTVAGDEHLEARPLEVVADELHDLGLVVDDQDRAHGGIVRAGPEAGPAQWQGQRVAGGGVSGPSPCARRCQFCSAVSTGGGTSPASQRERSQPPGPAKPGPQPPRGPP